MSPSSTIFPASLTGKSLYTIYAIIITLLTLPYDSFVYIIPSLRPHPNWTYYQAITNTLMNASLYHASIIEIQTSLPLSPGSEGANFVPIPPAKDHLYLSILTPAQRPNQSVWAEYGTRAHPTLQPRAPRPSSSTSTAAPSSSALAVPQHAALLQQPSRLPSSPLKPSHSPTAFPAVTPPARFELRYKTA